MLVEEPRNHDAVDAEAAEIGSQLAPGADQADIDISALLAIPLLGEWPRRTDWTAIVLISSGVYLASGGRLPKSR